MIDCGESDSMIEICGRLNESNTYKGLVVFTIFYPLCQEFLQVKPFSEFFYIEANWEHTYTFNLSVILLRSLFVKKLKKWFSRKKFLE